MKARLSNGRLCTAVEDVFWSCLRYTHSLLFQENSKLEKMYTNTCTCRCFSHETGHSVRGWMAHQPPAWGRGPGVAQRRAVQRRLEKRRPGRPRNVVKAGRKVEIELSIIYIRWRWQDILAVVVQYRLVDGKTFSACSSRAIFFSLLLKESLGSLLICDTLDPRLVRGNKHTVTSFGEEKKRKKVLPTESISIHPLLVLLLWDSTDCRASVDGEVRTDLRPENLLKDPRFPCLSFCPLPIKPYLCKTLTCIF